MQNSQFLIIINGPHGIGKSTLAKTLHADFSMSYLIPITNIRNGFSHFENDRSTSIKKTFSLAQKMTEHLLGQGISVIIEGVFRESDLDKFSLIAKKTKSMLHHFILEAPLDVVLKRADKRGYKNIPVGGMTRNKIISFYEDFCNQKDNFINPIAILTEKKSPEEIYTEVRQYIN